MGERQEASKRRVPWLARWRCEAGLPAGRRGGTCGGTLCLEGSDSFAWPKTPTKKIFFAGNRTELVPFSFLPACATRHSLNESTDSRSD